MTTYAVITTDVCWTCGDDFQATLDGKDYGVPLIVEMLNARGFKGTFFVSPYYPAQLKGKMLENLRYLVSSGHDLQLHTHVEPIDPLRPELTQYSASEKKEILGLGIDTLMRAGANPPIAHRAGNLAIDGEILRLLPELGICIDSSIYHRWNKSSLLVPKNLRNRFVRIGGVYQLPIFLIKIMPLIGQRGLTSFQLNSTIWSQHSVVLKKVADNKSPLVTILVHFFDLYKFARNEKPFEPLRPLSPNYEKINELKNILDMLKADTRFQVVTVRELWDIHYQNPNALDRPSYVPYTGLIPTFIKCCKLVASESIYAKS
jgi:peptidoglycan/xylan/chitin deacetylase (PgdA/CDA1 family)